jgi:hypothetical protein
VALDDDDPLWARHSGGIGHSGVEWGDGDNAIAVAFYADLPATTRFVFDLLMDRPGERLTSDWIAEQLSQRQGDGERTLTRQSVSGSLSQAILSYSRSGRRLPYYWWRQSGGGASRLRSRRLKPRWHEPRPCFSAHCPSLSLVAMHQSRVGVGVRMGLPAEGFNPS